MFRKLLGMALAVVTAASALAAEWMNDWEAAKARAAAQNKVLLVDFTGSDWCVYCIRMRESVLDTPEFEAYARDKFVLMEVDLPRKHAIPEALLKQNNDLCRRYGVDGFPTLLVIAPDGRLLGGFAGAVLDLPGVESRLDSALGNAALLEQADAAQGAERARLLYQVYQNIPQRLRPVSGLGERILEADPDNVTGFRTEMEVMVQWHDISVMLEDAGTDPDLHRAVLTEALKTALPPNRIKLERMLVQLDFCDIYREVETMADTPAAAVAFLEGKEKTVPVEILGEVLALKAEMQILAAKDVQDILAAKATMERSYRYNDPSAQYRAYQEKRFSDPAALLRQVRSGRAQ